MPPASYDSWSREDLIARLHHLDAQLPSSRTHIHPSKPSKRKTKTRPDKPFAFYAYPRRKIALRFCYAGWEYNGLAFQRDPTPLPTVEGALFDALAACRLIDPFAGPDGCGWERCGRTDRGVSGAGQVVSLWVRSNLGMTGTTAGGAVSSSLDDAAEASTSAILPEDNSNLDSDLPLLDDVDVSSPTNASLPPTQRTSPKQELRYVSILNRVLPPTIRIIAWSHVDPDFSARFACRFRHYKYFFRATDGGNGQLDVDAMRAAAARLVGEHDFRNLCKMDASKQIKSFRRRVLRADISPCAYDTHDDRESAASSMMYVLDLVGTAFLYNQVRHIMAVLFLVGAGLEHPSVVSALLNADAAVPEPPFREGEDAPPLVDCKPEYQMADALPLVLWDCAYKESDVRWQTDGDMESKAPGVGDETEVDGGMSEKESEGEVSRNLFQQMHAIHTRSLIHSALDAHFLRATAALHPPPRLVAILPPTSVQAAPTMPDSGAVLNIPIGGGMSRRVAARGYVPLLFRKRLEPVEVVNERWRLGTGAKRAVIGQVVAEDGDGDE